MKIKYEQNQIRNTKLTFDQSTPFIFDHFLKVCPYTIEELHSKNKKNDISQWRQIGMCWYAIENLSLTKAGYFFQRDHTTIHHAMRRIRKRSSLPKLNEKIEQVLTFKSE